MLGHGALVELLHRIVEQVDENPHVGDELAVTDEAEVELTVVALDGQVETDAVTDRADGIEVLELCARRVQRMVRPRNVGDDHVHRWVEPVGDAQPAEQAHRLCGDGRRGELREVLQCIGTHRIEPSFGLDHPAGDAQQALHRIDLVGRQLTRESRDPVAEDVLLVGPAHADGHHRHERRFGQRVVELEVAAQGSCAQGHHDIVERHAVGPADLASVLERERREREPPVRADACVERRSRRREP